jgi:hypothetical protein
VLSAGCPYLVQFSFSLSVFLILVFCFIFLKNKYIEKKRLFVGGCPRVVLVMSAFGLSACWVVRVLGCPCLDKFSFSLSILLILFFCFIFLKNKYIEKKKELVVGCPRVGLSACCLHVVRMLSTCCPRVARVLGCPHVVRVLPACCPRVARMLSACCPRVVRVLSAIGLSAFTEVLFSLSVFLFYYFILFSR